jgi:unsaturated chondroitin disaccharide hydrolase
MNETIVVPDATQQLAANAMTVAEAKVRAFIAADPDFFPLYTKNGKWRHESEAWTNWCEGFLGGQMWIFADRTQSAEWREAAEHYSLLLRGREFDRDVHDLGFTFWPTWKRWFTLTGDAAIDDVVVQAGRTMALRSHESSGFLRSFLAEDSTFIDIMMNVGIIFYAAKRTGDQALLDVANRHCMATRRYMVRGDGSTSHEGVFDLSSGTFLRQTTQQGFRDDSSWARGQAWALYGFGTCFAFTNDRRYLDTAVACADFFLERTGAAIIPPNDWEEPSPVVPFESSAAAIAASGLLQLAALVDDPARAERYSAGAFAIVGRLCGDEFLATEDAGWQGIVKRGSYHETKSLGVNESVMWGDYFFVEVLDKCLGGEWVTTNR